MSWDATIAKTSDPKFIKPADEARFLPMGTALEVRNNLTTAAPSIEWSSASQGHAYVGSLSLEFSFLGKIEENESLASMAKRPQDADEVGSIGVSARGAGDPLEVVISIAKANQWSVFDSQEGTWIDLNAPSKESWKDFTEFRDMVAQNLPGDRHPPTSSGSLATNLFIVAAGLFLVVFAVRYLFK